MATSPPQLPDPVLTASLYVSGRLDELAVAVVEPFWREMQEHQDGRGCYLWMVRYGKRGEHLKLRLHGPAGVRPLARRLLARHAAGYFDSLPPPSATVPPRREPHPEMPAIDPDDEGDGLVPDRTLRWTRYRRSQVSLGGRPLLEDDAYAAHLTRCLAAGCELVLAALVADGGGERSDRRRQNDLLKILLAALPALGFAAAERDAYLTYHRDWLVRFAAAGDGGEAEKLRQVFAAEAGRLAGSVRHLAAAFGTLWGTGSGGIERTAAEAALCRSLSRLVDRVAALAEEERYRIDPFAGDPAYPALFKVFHGLANQLGFKILQEAFAYHLLVVAGAAARP